MLKIKDNIDLKELKKFGFEKFDDYYLFQNGYDDDFISYYDTIKIDLYCKELEICSVNNKNIDDKVFDLIEASLVEKV